MGATKIYCVPFHFISFINSCCEAKDSQKSVIRYVNKFQFHNEEVSAIDVGVGKPLRIIPGKTHAVRQGLTNPIYIVPRQDLNWGPRGEGKTRQDVTMPT